jgi:spore germination protein Q
MMNNPYYSEAKGIPQSYGTYTGAQMPGKFMPYMAPGMSTYPSFPSGAYPSYMAPGSMGPGAMALGTMAPGTMAPGTMAPGTMVPGGPALEESYIENILRLNLGKTATLYLTFENNAQWNAKVFNGVIEAAGRDHIIISDPQTGMRYLLLMVNLDYITFDEELNYSYPSR